MANYESDYYEQKELWGRNLLEIPAEKERILETIAFIPSDVLTILDVGCGNGAFLNALPNKYKAVGLDRSEEALKYVRTDKVCGDITSLPFESKTFDLVTCLEVLEHLPSGVFEKACSEIQRVSKKYIMVSVPNSEKLVYHLVICPQCCCFYNPHRHVRSFDPKKLETLFEGFYLVELREIGPVEYYPTYNQALTVAYRLWKNVIPPSTAICPQCGYRPSGNSSSSYVNTKTSDVSAYMAKWLKAVAKFLWRPLKRRRWLLALYERKQQG